MRQPQNPKRGRGRGRRGNNSNGHNHVPNRNTSYESNGPDVKLRGNAQQLHEKYMALAHDAATSGERILAEACTQFADHYFRLHQAAVGVAETKRQQDHADAVAADEDESKSVDPKVADVPENLSGVDLTSPKATSSELNVTAPVNTADSEKPAGAVPKRRKNGTKNNNKPAVTNESVAADASLSQSQLMKTAQDDPDADQPS